MLHSPQYIYFFSLFGNITQNKITKQSKLPHQNKKKKKKTTQKTTTTTQNIKLCNYIKRAWELRYQAKSK
jgi:hypothetical protein